MSARLGLNAKLYRNTAGFSSPTWAEMKEIRDLTTGAAKGEADASTRGTGGFEATVGTLKSLDIQFDVVMDTTDPDGHIAAIEDSYFNGTKLDLAVMNGPITVAGSRGWRARYECFKFDESQPLTDVQKISIGLKPTYDEVNGGPARLVVV